MLTIAIPTRNRASYLEKCLRAFLAQIEQNPDVDVKICISDNGSTDSTSAVVAALQLETDRIRYSRNETNLGYQRNIIRLVEMAETDFLWFFGDDDLPLDDGLKKVIEKIRAYRAGVYVLMDEETATASHIPEFHSGPDITGRLLDLCNQFGWLVLTSNLTRLVVRTDRIKTCAFDKYLTTSFTHSCLAFEAHAFENSVIIRDNIVVTPPRTEAELQAIQQQWNEERHMVGYYYTVDALEYMAKAVTDDLHPTFFRLGRNYLWDCYVYQNILGVLNSHQPQESAWPFISRAAALIKDKAYAKIVEQNAASLLHASRSYSQLRAFLQDAANRADRPI
ncbi:glycosyltransferase family 2 protein [Azospirillum sp.]|uniref:glycosyltransferase family 2 protein n=1 Tax=Azospirillum sp. TaxID=34012 RepID=UPI002613EEF7|nr:glycosyltransferase family 2 protein [Azospirillum sp.]